MDEQNMGSVVKNKKMLYIVGTVVVLLLIGGFIAAKFMTRGTVGNMAYNTNGTQTYSNNEGTVTVGSTTMPKSWPSDAPANYQGAKILFSGDSNPQTGESGAVVSYNLQGASVGAVADYYRAQLTAKGWAIEGNANVGTQTILSATKNDRTFGVSIVDTGNGSIMVTAGLELQ